MVCPRCRETLPFTKTAAKQSFPHVSVCCSPFFYTDVVRASLLRFKFRGCTGYAEAYGEFLAKCIDENGISCDSITWVPLSRQRLRKRGYDQARLLAESLSKRTGFPCEPTLTKRRNNPPQSTIHSTEKRKKNVRNLFASLLDADIKGKRFLLVDDIVTTGATLSACAEVLKKAGAAEIKAVTVTRGKL